MEGNARKKYELFCEMDEFQQSTVEWKEMARWLRFEEIVEVGGRWSKPHVASIQLNALFELKKCLLNGLVSLNVDGDDLTSIIERIMSDAVEHLLIKREDLAHVRSILLAKHVHQFEKEFQKQIDKSEPKALVLVKSIANLTKKNSSLELNELKSANNDATNSEKSNNDSSQTSQQPSKSPSAVFDLDDTSIRNNDSKAKDLCQFGSNMSIITNPSRNDFKPNSHFMKKIPPSTEAVNVLVGEVNFLNYQFTAFVRLNKAVVLADFTEVPLPTRFLFILLGPKGHQERYRQIGRSMSTLMSDELFHQVAYIARSKQQLLDAYHEFVDQLTVLPPGEWDPSIRIEPPKRLPLIEERLERIYQSYNKDANPNEKNDDDQIYAHEVGPELQFTGRFCGGLIDDIKRKLPWYLSDFTDGFNIQSLSTILFMYFASLAPIITFGGLLGTATNQYMSAIESLLSGAICGILYSLFAGQPMAILGSTGPVLIFEQIINVFSNEYGLDYIGFRAVIGIWVCILLLLIVFFDASAFVKYITRFTEESFAVLIAFIFIKESFSKLYEINKTHAYSNDPFNYVDGYLTKNCFSCRLRQSSNHTFVFYNVSNVPVVNFNGRSLIHLNKSQCLKLGIEYEYVAECDKVPDVFFFSVILYITTFSLAMALRSIRQSRFFPVVVRSKLSDFSVVITILINILIDQMFNLNTPKLVVPPKFETTIPSRGWFINPVNRLKLNVWIVLGSLVPAILATILIFMDQHITAVIVNRKENKLKKSFGYHLDLFIIAITVGINSLLGIPWFVAATVLSINNVISLKQESDSSVPGERPKFLGVIEQRLTGVIVFVLIGSSVFLAKFLAKIPMPVLYGVFLYMGVSSLNGIQFMNRLTLPFMPEKYQPDYLFLRTVKTIKVHMFTLIQFVCLLLLFFIKMSKKLSITFPIMVLALVGIRKLLDFLFTQKELFYLDQILSTKKNTLKYKNNNSSTAKNESQVMNNKNNTNEHKTNNETVAPLLLNSNSSRMPPPKIIIEDMDEDTA